MQGWIQGCADIHVEEHYPECESHPASVRGEVSTGFCLSEYGSQLRTHVLFYYNNAGNVFQSNLGLILSSES